jgi:hypothetical protein
VFDTTRVYTNEELVRCDLIVDAVYKGGGSGNAGDEPIHKLLGCGVQGGFRYRGPHTAPSLLVLYSSLEEPDWPDYLDMYSGQFTYHGDNRTPGHEILDTHKKGNVILERCFEKTHTGDRAGIPPIFIFTKGRGGREVVFKGIAVPGGRGLKEDEDLVAVWKSKHFERFQNYRAVFTILDEPVVSRAWIDELRKNTPLSSHAPKSWSEWIRTGRYSPLVAERTLEYRSKAEQLPQRKDECDMIRAIYDHFTNPYDFEKAAAEIFKLMDSNVVSYDLTRPWRDGGRDAVGKYRIGSRDESIVVEFALEAKCNSIDNGVGIRGTSRLISRLKHRQFGVFVTTSFVSGQAYKEIKEDQHPVIILSAIDIVWILKENGYGTPDQAIRWLQSLES